MKITITAITLVYLTSFVTANHLKTTGVMMTSDDAMTSNTDPNRVTPSAGLTITSIPTVQGKRAAALPVAVGIVSNKVDAKGNNILITKSNITISKSDQVKLAHTIKEMMSSSQEASKAISMNTDDIFRLLTRIANNSAMLSHAAGVISAAKSGDTGALTVHVVGLLDAAVPAAIKTSSPSSAIDTPVVAPAVTSVAASADTADVAMKPVSTMLSRKAPTVSA